MAEQPSSLPPIQQASEVHNPNIKEIWIHSYLTRTLQYLITELL